MAQNIFGVPLSGADICGYEGNTTPELCARWHVVGAFQPFSRNYNSFLSSSQEPYEFSDDIYENTITYTDIMRNAIQTKYHFLKYYYTGLANITAGGGAFYKPLFFEFPNDTDAYKNQQYNVMLGPALKLSVNSDTLD